MEAPASAAVGGMSYHNGGEERRERGGNYRANKALAASAREKEGGERAFWLGGDLPLLFSPKSTTLAGEKVTKIRGGNSSPLSDFCHD